MPLEPYARLWLSHFDINISTRKHQLMEKKMMIKLNSAQIMVKGIRGYGS